MSKEPREPKHIAPSTLEDAPIGSGPDGGIITVEKDAPPFRPKIVDDEGNEVEIGDDD